MAKANAEVITKRVDHLQGMILAGETNTACVAYARQTWGCSRRNARDLVCAARKDRLDAAYISEEIDQKDLLFQQVGRLERIARMAENSG